MMSDATNPLRIIDGALRLIDDDGSDAVSGDELHAWRQFQVDMVKNFNIVVTDNSMPMEISKKIAGRPNRTIRLRPQVDRLRPAFEIARLKLLKG